MRAALIGLVLTAGLAVRSVSQVPEDLQKKFDAAERQIVRLPPTDFKELPNSLARELERRGCTIPQEASSEVRNNVIRGQFEAPGQTDWAVLCSVHGFSSILVFWNGSERHPAELARAEDRTFLQGMAGEKIGFSRAISAVDKEFILRHYEAYGGPAPPPIDHQGIDDAFVGKASVTHYYYKGQWSQLTGAD
jgi:hypothetical protein